MNLEKRYVLLVDDDEDDRMFFEEALDELKLDINLKTATNGNEALVLLEKSDKLPEIIFLDLNMPILNGYETLKRIRNNKSFNTITLIIYSTSSNQYSIQQLKNEGANYYICKPSDFKILKDVINSALTLTIQGEGEKINEFIIGKL